MDTRFLDISLDYARIWDQQLTKHRDTASETVPPRKHSVKDRRQLSTHGTKVKPQKKSSLPAPDYQRSSIWDQDCDDERWSHLNENVCTSTE